MSAAEAFFAFVADVDATPGCSYDVVRARLRAFVLKRPDLGSPALAELLVGGRRWGAPAPAPAPHEAVSP